VRVSGLGQGTGPLSLRDRDSLTGFRATQIATQKAYQMAGISPKDIDFAEVHDAFTPFEVISTEDLGFFPPGKGVQAVEEGRTLREGRLPVNLFLSLRAPHRLDYSMREHDQILDAFLKRNPELAQAAAVKHLENQMQVLKTVLDLGDEVKGSASSERK